MLAAEARQSAENTQSQVAAAEREKNSAREEAEDAKKLGDGLGVLATQLRMGLKLPAVFRQAGLPAPQLSLSAAIAAGADSPAYENLAEAVRSLLPRMEEFGIASPDEVEVDTLEERLRAEAQSLGGIMVYPATIGAWTRMR